MSGRGDVPALVRPLLMRPPTDATLRHPFPATSVQPLSHRQLLELIAGATDVDSFCATLSSVQQWQSEALADLRHFSGVLEWIHDVLTDALTTCPHILIDCAMGPVTEAAHVDVATHSLRVFSCLRFTALLLRNTYNKSLYPSHRLLAAFLAARVDAVAETAQLALCALIDIPTFYMAKVEESEHAGAIADVWQGC